MQVFPSDNMCLSRCTNIVSVYFDTQSPRQVYSLQTPISQTEIHVVVIQCELNVDYVATFSTGFTIYLWLFHSIQVMEKCIANQLKWDLNAVTTSEFIEELASRLSGLVTPEVLDKIIDHAHTISNVCLLCKYNVHLVGINFV